MKLDWPVPQPDPSKANTKDADVRTVLLQEYGDHGHWARHYSTVRMTLGTFFITAATGMITFRWDTPQEVIAVTAGAIFGIGVILFMIFSFFTFKEMNSQFDIADLYRTKLDGEAISAKDRPRLFKMTGTALPIAVLFVIVFVSFDLYWLLCSKPELGKATQITVPLKVQVGQQHEIMIDVPIKLSVP
jgi:hypothetical protein